MRGSRHPYVYEIYILFKVFFYDNQFLNEEEEVEITKITYLCIKVNVMQPLFSPSTRPSQSQVHKKSDT